MQDLMVTNQDSLTMTSTQLLSLVNSKREEFSENPVRLNQFNDRIIDELEGDDYKTFVVENPNKTTSTVYELTIDQCMLVSMRESKSVRKSVLAMLNKTKPVQPVQPALPQNYLEALEHLVIKEKQLIEQAPKVEFVNRFIESTGNKSFRQVAKLLKANEREFRAFLYESKVMYQLGGGWTAHANHIDAGRFYVTGGEANGHAYTTCKFTPKGIEYIAGKWISHKEVK